MKIKRILAVFLVVLLSYFGSTAILNKLEAKELRAINGDSFDDDAASVSEHEHLMLLVGVDENPEGEDEEYTRTDTIMLVKANSQTGEVDILSIPRDTRLKIRDTFDKVNHAHAFGGIDLTLKTLRDFLGLDIDYYVQVNFKAVENIIDDLGGVDFDVPKGFNAKTGGVTVKEGKNHLSGKEALAYLRTRSIYNNGDIGRVEAQQGFMKAMVDELVKKSDKVDLTKLATTYLKYVRTNLPMGDIVDLTTNIKKFSSAKVKTHMVPGHEETIYGVSYYLPDFEKTQSIIDKNFAPFKLKNWTKAKSGFVDEPKDDPAPNSYAPQAEPDEYYEPRVEESYDYYEPAPSKSYDYIEEETYEPAPSYTPPRRENTEERESPEEVETPEASESPEEAEPEDDQGLTTISPEEGDED